VANRNGGVQPHEDRLHVFRSKGSVVQFHRVEYNRLVSPMNLGRILTRIQ
jgi:hypothetical protein